MPDILCTTGILIVFLLGNGPASSLVRLLVTGVSQPGKYNAAEPGNVLS
jgi:hypothetical protein